METGPMWPFWRRRPAGPSGRSRDTPCGCCAPVPGCRRCWLRSAPSCTPRARRARTSTSSTCTPSSTERRWWAACRWLPFGRTPSTSGRSWSAMRSAAVRCSAESTRPTPPTTPLTPLWRSPPGRRPAGSWPAAWPRPTSPSCSSRRAARERSCTPRPSTTPAPAPPGCSLPSTAPTSTPICWSPSSSAIPRGPLLAPSGAGRSASLRPPPAGRSFWTRSPRWTSASRPSFCAPSRSAASGRWAAWRRWRPTCASSPPATPICPAMWRRGNSAPTCSTASTPSPSTSRRCGSGERTSLLSAAACWTSCPASSSDAWS